MSTTTVTRAEAPGAVGRIVNVVKLHFTNPGTVLVWPLMIVAMIFLANLAIWWIIGTSITDPADHADAIDGFQWSGASFFIFVYMMVVAVQAMNQTFAYALGLSVTRRDYYLGSAAAFVLLALILTVILATAGAAEGATGGWGLGGRMFTAVYFGDGSWLQRAFIMLALFLFFFFVGAAVAGIFVRFRTRGLTIFFMALGVALVGAAALITAGGLWPAVGEGLATAGPMGIASWSLVATVVAAVAGFVILRRATPRG